MGEGMVKEIASWLKFFLSAPYRRIDRLQSTESHMSMETNILARVGQAILAVSATSASVLVLQLAMVAA
jgi:hypothetical protein